MRLTLNGESHELPGDASTVEDLIKHLGLAKSAVAVEVNRSIVPKGQHAQAPLNDGDEVEIVTLVGGG